MKDSWRLIVDSALPGSRNMAIDYAIMKALSAGGSPPTLRLYEWAFPAITIGYFQVIEDEIEEAVCLSENVPVIRRITGGGAVLHEHEITYSIAVTLKNRIACSSILDSYRVLCDPIVAALSAMGLRAQFSPVNDILVDGKKISGSAQTRRDSVLLQHGTILLDVDTEKMFRYLKVAKEKTDGRGQAPAERVISAARILGKKALSSRFRDRLIKTIAGSYAEAFNADFGAGVLSVNEKSIADAAEMDIFTNEEWNRNRKAHL
jgi:lipoate---protein ligase